MKRLIGALVLSIVLAAPAWAITPTLLTSGSDQEAGDPATATTDPITPTANRPVMAIVYLYHTGSDGLTSISGAGLTWTARQSYSVVGDTFPEIHIWTGVSASPSTGALTITPVNSGTNEIAWIIVDLVDASSTPWVGNTDDNEGTGTTASATLAAFANAGNAAIAATFFADSDTMTAEAASYTEIHQMSVFGGSLNVIYRANNGDLTPSVALGSSALWAMVANEIAASGGGGGGAETFGFRLRLQQ